jgi:hypothetical protein
MLSMMVKLVNDVLKPQTIKHDTESRHAKETVKSGPNRLMQYLGRTRGLYTSSCYKSNETVWARVLLQWLRYARHAADSLDCYHGCSGRKIAPVV